jgi:Tfp pilus assembly protein FimT
MTALLDRRRGENLGSRRGATLLELLTVIVVLLMITTATVPVVAPHVQGRRIREAARMISTFVNAGRSRAIETGRPAGVWIERMPNVPEASNMLFFAEIPQVYAGDFLDSRAELCVVGRQTGTSTWPNTSDQEFYNIVIPRNRNSYNADIWSIPPSSASVGTHQLVRELDLIKFEGFDRFYTLRIHNNLAVPNSQQRQWWYLLKGINAKTANATKYTNEVNVYLQYVIHWFGGINESSVGWGSVLRTTTIPFTSENIGLRYQIYRQPQRLQAGSIRLPEGVVIDLNFSSVTHDEFQNWNGSGIPGEPLHPRKGSNYYLGDPFHEKDNTPIVFVFSPDGRMQLLYRQNKDPSANLWNWEGSEPFGNVYLLVGERRNIVPHETGNSFRQLVPGADQEELDEPQRTVGARELPNRVYGHGHYQQPDHDQSGYKPVRIFARHSRQSAGG